jgi:hypothetical protein
MPMYVQNGKLIQKAGALGTSAGCCCQTPSGPAACASVCSGNNVPANITFTISNFAGIAFSLLNPNGSYIVPSDYANTFPPNCFSYGAVFYPYSPPCSFPYNLIGEENWVRISVFPDRVVVSLSERISGTCVGDKQDFTLSNWITKLCGRPTGFPITGTATTATSHFGAMTFDWEIDL